MKQDNVRLKKKYGQHFLRDLNTVHHIVDAVTLGPDSSVMEIGCGDGFLTEAILYKPLVRLWCFEIDAEWIQIVQQKIADSRLTIFHQDILTTDLQQLAPHAPWVLLANLPYNITFPILYLLQQNRHLFTEGVIMIQEEVAHKITKTSGKDYGYTSLFFQRYFTWRKLDKIPPSAFFPPPKVFSRLLYFKPKQDVIEIANEPAFWEFIKVCFKQPRRTLRNNLMHTNYPFERLDEQTLQSRAQQFDITALLTIWNTIQK